MNAEKAFLYEKYRLPYASQWVGGLLERTGEVKIVADIGAGTGQLARCIASRSRKVYAIEPDPAMRQAAAITLAAFSNIEILAGVAEALPFTDHTIDLIVIGNAFHRFKTEACIELRRILQPHGWIALVSYVFLDENFTRALSTKLSALNGLSGRIESSWHNPSIQDLFGQAQVQTLSYRQSCSEDWIAFFGAACAGIEAPEPGDTEYPLFQQLNRQLFDEFSEQGVIQVEYETRVSFAQLDTI